MIENIFDISLFKWNKDRDIIVMSYEMTTKLPHEFPIKKIGIKGKYETRTFLYQGQNFYKEHIYINKDYAVVVFIQTKETKELNDEWLLDIENREKINKRTFISKVVIE